MYNLTDFIDNPRHFILFTGKRNNYGQHTMGHVEHIERYTIIFIMWQQEGGRTHL